MNVKHRSFLCQLDTFRFNPDQVGSEVGACRCP